MKFHPIEFVKHHPLSIALGVGAVVLLYLLYSSSSSSSGAQTASYAAGPSDAAVAASASVANTQIQANAAANQTNAELTASQNQQAASIALAQIQANSAAYSTDATTTVNIAGINAQQQVQIAGISAGVQTADLANQAALAQAGIYEHIFDAQSNAQISASNNAAMVATTQLNDTAAIQLGQINAGVQTAQTLGSSKLASLINHAQSTGGSINIGGITAGGGSGASNGVATTIGALGNIFGLAGAL